MKMFGQLFAGLPLSAWVLLLAVIVIPLAIEFAFLYHHWRRNGRRSTHTDTHESGPS